MKTEHKVIAVSVVFGLLVWIVDAVLDYLLFYEGTFWGLLITDVPGHELYIRSFTVASFLVFGIVLSRVMAARKWAEKRVAHFNLVLRAIRDVNQLIAKEKDRDRLLQGACKSLIETRGYHSTWIALLDESGGLMTTAEAGLGEEFLPLAEQLRRGELPACGRLALSQSGVVTVEKRSSTCADCPLSKNHGDMAAMTVRLEHSGKVYGLLTVRNPSDFITDEEERSLFQEVAGDIAFALHATELEEERKRIKEAQWALSSRYEAILTAIPDIIMEVDANKVYTWANLAGLKFFGENALGKEAAFYFEGEQGTYGIVQPLFNGAEDVIYVESWQRRQDGEKRLLAWWCRVLKDANGDVIGALSTARDITERKQAEERLKDYSERLEEMVEERTQELRDAQEQLVRREKLAILGQLAGGVGHDLRNPLGVISNAVYFLQMTHPDADEITKEYLDIISEEVRNSTRIISDLLDFSRTRMPDREEVAVSELVAQVLQKHPSPEGVEVTTGVDPDLSPVHVDPQQIGQVLDNLVVNAYQAMKEVGALTISAQAEGGSQIALSVTDTGCGISDENMARLFEPLFTTKARGIGLGLATSRNLVEANRGSIEAESEEGKGSTFTVRLPTREGVA